MSKMKELYQKVIELHEAGKSVQEIAALTGFPALYIESVLVVEQEDTPLHRKCIGSLFMSQLGKLTPLMTL
jgi:hypothetical protein